MVMPHTLKTITDADNYFVIDPITRTITNQTNKNSLTQYDHNSEVFTFKIPMMVEGHDMSSSDVIQIHYINKGQNNSKPGVYEVSDSMVITEDGVAYIVFSWLVSQNATSLTGDITFQIKFICYDKSNPSLIDYSWGTKVFSAINVLPGINNTEIIVEEYADILQQWKIEIEELIKSGSGGGSGKSAYQIALEYGFEGTEEEWLDSLEGKDGKPYAYMLTVGEDGTLYCEYADTDTPPNFVYDEETGYVYYVTENSTRYEVLDVNIIVEKVLGQLPEGGATTFSLMSIDNEIGTKDLVITDESGQTILNMSFVRDDTDTATIMTVSNIDGQSVDITIRDGVDGQNGVDGKDGKDGQDYELTANDKNEIAELVKTLIPLSDYAKTTEVNNKISTHNTATDSHNDIRLLVQTLTNQLNALADSDDETLDQLSEIVAYIKSNKELIESVTTSKVNVSDIIDNLTTNISDKPLSAKQGVILKGLIDAIEIPTDYVKSVNSILPNNNGDVSIPLDEYAKTDDIPTDYIKTVNGVAPNENGNVTISVTLASPDVVDSVEEMTYENKQYVLSSTGTIWAYKTVEGKDITVNDDKTVTCEIDKRISTSEKKITTTGGYILLPAQEIDMEHLPVTYTISGLANWYNMDNGRISTNIMFLDSDGNSICAHGISSATGKGYVTNHEYISESNTYTNLEDQTVSLIFTADNIKGCCNGNSVAYFQLSTLGTTATSTAVVSCSYEVPGEPTAGWVDTKVPFSGKDYSSEIAALQSEVDALKASSGGDVIPSYVIEEAERVADNILSVRNGKSFVFLAGSDLHVNIDDSVSKTAIEHMGQGMAQIRRHTTPDCIVLLGDYVDNASETVAEAKSEIKYARNSVSEAMKGCPTLWLNGNHDCSSGVAGNRLTNNEIFSYVGSNNSNAPTIVVDDANIVKNYGYIDFAKQKIRLIYLNTSDMVEASTLVSYFTKTQGDWLASKALDLSSKGDDEEKWGVIICSHHPFTSREDIKNILFGFVDKTSGSANTNDGTVSFDFTKVKASFISHFHGHIHNFRVDTYISNGGKSITSITIPNACPTQNNSYFKHSVIVGEPGSYEDEAKLGEVDPDTGEAVYHNKEAGNYTDTSFCAITVDRENSTIYAHCYGAGVHRVTNYKTGETTKYSKEEV